MQPPPATHETERGARAPSRALRVARLAVGGWVLAVAALAGSGEALACSCGEGSLVDDAVASAYIVEAAIVDVGPVRGGDDVGTQRFRLRVDATYAGRPVRFLDVRYQHCNTAALTPAPEESRIWFLRRRGGVLTAHLCDGGAAADEPGRAATRTAVARALRRDAARKRLARTPLTEELVMDALVAGVTLARREYALLFCGAPAWDTAGLGLLAPLELDLRRLRWNVEPYVSHALGESTRVARVLRFGNLLAASVEQRSYLPLSAEQRERLGPARAAEIDRDGAWPEAELLAAGRALAPDTRLASSALAELLTARAGATDPVAIGALFSDACGAIVGRGNTCDALPGRIEAAWLHAGCVEP